MHNKFVNRTFFATLHFAVASPLYRKTPLHKKCLYKGFIISTEIKTFLFSTLRPFAPSLRSLRSLNSKADGEAKKKHHFKIKMVLVLI